MRSTRDRGGIHTYFLKDLLGRDTVVLRATSRASGASLAALRAGGVRQEIVYDLMDRVEETRTLGPAMPLSDGTTTPEETIIVVNEYDDEGNLVQLDRSTIPDPTNVQTVSTWWDYDRAGRRVREVAADPTPADTTDNPDEVTGYDPAGNAVQVRTRNGEMIAMGYDALNRLRTRSYDAVEYAFREEGIPTTRPGATIENTLMPGFPFYPNYPNPGADRSRHGLEVPGDIEEFDYDAMGNLTIANNAAARVTRTYHPNGQLETETQEIAQVGSGLTPGAFGAHSYTLTYAYHPSGQRKKLTHPAGLGSVPDAATEYAYHAAYGSLQTVRDADGGAYTYHYDARHDVDLLSLPQGYEEVYRYDAVGNLSVHQLWLPGQALLRNETLSYDGRGKVLGSGNTEGSKDVLSAEYSGLGYVVRSGLTSYGATAGGTGVQYTTREKFQYDPLGNARVMESSGNYRSLADAGAYRLHATVRTSAFETGTGRLRVATMPGRRDEYRYDEAGNTIFSFTSQFSTGENEVQENRASYYSADGRLRVSDTRRISGEAIGGSDGEVVYEEYRYDALGRRVWVRTRQFCLDGVRRPSCAKELSLVRRTVWDGEQELYEIQMPGSDDPRVAQWMENDTQPLSNLPIIPDLPVDRYPYFGRVMYTHGLRLDQPLAVTRMNYQDQPWGADLHTWDPFTVVVHWNSRGQGSGYHFSDGQSRCRDADGQQSCVQVGFPAGWFAYARQLYAGQPASWQGTLLRDKQDAGGQMYRRNRYYDPASGRFTQEDPIGLAGGINLYGFAEGDPVNFSDPFGLNPCLVPPVASACWTAIMAGAGAVAGLLESTGFQDGAAGFSDYLLDNARTVGLVGGALLAEEVVPTLGQVKGALQQVHDVIGKQPKGKPGKFGSPQRGTPQRGYRLDPAHDRPAGHPESVPHINWWDYTQGKRGSGGRAGAIPLIPFP